MLKRHFDIIVASLAVVVLAIPMLLIGVIIKLTGKGPVLFRQQRPGKGGKPFEIIKFRTMRNVRDGNGQLLPDANRLTSIGKFLRSTSLDELPELINVLCGNMSLVGPRPLLMKYLPLYSPDQQRRHSVKPGITGWAQVNGRNALSWREKLALDTWYVDHQSMWLDVKIIAMTFCKVLKREGISQPGHATMEEFKG